MFTNQIKIMLYVSDVEASAMFWQKIGFVEKQREHIDGTIVVEIAPSENCESQIVLYDRSFIQQHSPEVAGNTPSLMFFTKDVRALYKKMKAQHVRVGEIVDLPTGLIFNFIDNDDNYFAVSGK